MDFVEGPDEQRRSRRTIWAAGAVLVVLLGSAGSVFAASAVARNNSQKSGDEFKDSSAQVASTLKLSIQHEQDLVVSAAGFVVSSPDATEAQFITWAKAVRALQRYPELNGFGESVIVPASQLSAFAARAVDDPSAPLSPGGTFQVIPPGSRPVYCFSRFGQSRDASDAPVGYDYCAGIQGLVALANRDSGQGSYVPISFDNVSSLAIQIPVYRGGVTPPTVDSREAAFLGWIGMSLRPKVLLATALVGHPAMSVSLRYGVGAA
ncbi:MAG TPA: CHASE domain-containing protein, partial [Actinomycetota bacterium]|nr:CHASE domain-containing protein [Actinomycetota bacterium]